MRYLVTGGCGFIGSNLASKVLKNGDELFLLDNLSRFGATQNLSWLKSQGEFKFYNLDIRNSNDVETIVKEVLPDVVFHLAGQVAMTTSIINPKKDFETNVLGTFNLLESIRKNCPNSIILYSSTNKVYGDFSNLNFIEEETRYSCLEFPNGISEDYPLDFHSPYGCSKGAADQYLLDYHRIFGIKTVVFRHSSMYGGNQYSTVDQGWVGWFIQKALEKKNNNNLEKFLISGNGKQVRDVLHCSDVANLYFNAVLNIDKIAGQAFNIGGGVENSLSLLELFSILEDKLEVKLSFNSGPFRESDQLSFIADNSKICGMIDWVPQIDKISGIEDAINWSRSSI